jgi:four helix bundle protein
MYKDFEELPCWQEAARLYHKVLDLFEKPEVKLSSGFKDQIDRAALSISNNIAEGFERKSIHELAQFLGTARGSAGEVRSMVSVMLTHKKSHSILHDELTEIKKLAISCSKQITGWLHSIKKTNSQATNPPKP